MGGEQWEAVDWSALKQDDPVRMLHENGDVIHGTFHEERDRSFLKTNFGRFFVAGSLVRNGFSFERAVPERTLPTVEGTYASAALYATGDYCLYALNGYGWQTVEYGESWVGVNPNDLPADLVRLVPVTEVEEAEKRGIRKAHDHLRERGLLGAPMMLRRQFPDAFGEV